MTLDLQAAQESVDGLRKVAAAFDRKNMPAGAKANRALAEQTQALIDEVGYLREVKERVEAIAGGTKINALASALFAALADQCHHGDGVVECWHFGRREGRDG